MKKYFSYSSETGFSFFDTAEEAEADAKEHINTCRENLESDDEWPDYMDSICCGEISMKAIEKPAEIVSSLGVDCYFDYELEVI